MPQYDISARSSGGSGPKWVTSGGILQGITGAAVLSNLVMRLLFTTKGTSPTARSEGTQLSKLAGATLDLSQVQSLLISAVTETETYIKKLQLRAPVPKEETLVKLVPARVELFGDSLSATIMIFNAANTTTPLEVTL